LVYFLSSLLKNARSKKQNSIRKVYIFSKLDCMLPLFSLCLIHSRVWRKENDGEGGSVVT